jgi:hypothetical protein
LGIYEKWKPQSPRRFGIEISFPSQNLKIIGKNMVFRACEKVRFQDFADSRAKVFCGPLLCFIDSVTAPGMENPKANQSMGMGVFFHRDDFAEPGRPTRENPRELM